MTPPSRLLRRAGLPLLALLLAGLGWWALRDRSQASRSVPPVERAEDERAPPPPVELEEPTLQGAPDAERTDPAPGETDPEAASGEPWRLTFDVADADGAPRGWMRVELHDRQGHVRLQRWAEGKAPTEGELAPTGGGHLVVWSLERVPWVSDWLDPPPTGARHVEVRFERGLAVAGDVFEQDGVTPLAHGTVRVFCPARREPYRPVVGALRGLVQAGRFRVEGVPSGPVTVEAEAHDVARGRKARVEAEAGDEALRLVLGPQGVIRFLVVDRSTGHAPVTKYLEIRTVDDEGGERGCMAASTTRPGEPKPAEPFGRYFANPGETYRFRVHAQGYEPSATVSVAVPETGGALTARFELDPAPESIARLTLLVRTLDPPLPEWVMVTRHYGGGSTGHGMAHEDGRVVVELGPGTHHLSVGGGVSPRPCEDIWLPTRLDVEVKPDDEREIEVWIARGGWMFIPGDIEPRPDDVVFRRGDVKLVRHYRFQSWEGESGYFLGVLPPGRWTFEWTRRSEGRRGAVEIEKNEVTRLDPATIESFTVEEEE